MAKAISTTEAKGSILRRGLRKLEDIYDRLVDVFAVLASVLIAGLTASITLSVILRAITGHSVFPWTLEVSEYILLWFTFLSCAWLLRRDGHIRMDMVISHLSPGVQRGLNIFSSIVIAVVALIIFRWGISEVLEFYEMDYYIPYGLEIRSWIIDSIIPVGAFFLFIQSLRRIWRYVKGREVVNKGKITLIGNIEQRLEGGE